LRGRVNIEFRIQEAGVRRNAECGMWNKKEQGFGISRRMKDL
jgi:hypothetical protein